MIFIKGLFVAHSFFSEHFGKNSRNVNRKVVLLHLLSPKPAFQLNWLVVGSSSWQFISLLFTQHIKLDIQIKTMSEKGMLVTKRIYVKHTQIF